jgi:hypothetical protein
MLTLMIQIFQIESGKLPAMIEVEDISLLQETFSFRVRSPQTGGITLFVYAGCYRDEWVGLLGIGMLAD